MTASSFCYWRYRSATFTLLPTMVACRCVTSLVVMVLSIVHTVSSTMAPLGAVRLRGSSNAYEGRVEVSNGTHWGTVCDDFWTIQEGHVVCRQLNYRGAVWMYGGSDVQSNSGWLSPMEIVLDDLQCTGSESHLFNCRRNRGRHNCNKHTEAAGVECLDNTAIRLVTSNGVHPNYGFVQVALNGNWGKVCDDGWNRQSAIVVCRELGKNLVNWNPMTAWKNAWYGPEVRNSRFILDDLRCSGGEDKLVDCPHRDFWTSDCSEQEAAAVVCV